MHSLKHLSVRSSCACTPTLQTHFVTACAHFEIFISTQFSCMHACPAHSFCNCMCTVWNIYQYAVLVHACLPYKLILWMHVHSLKHLSVHNSCACTPALVHLQKSFCECMCTVWHIHQCTCSTCSCTPAQA